MVGVVELVCEVVQAPGISTSKLLPPDDCNQLGPDPDSAPAGCASNEGLLMAH